MSSQIRSFAAALAAAMLATAAPAYASTFSAAELTQDNALLNQFNLVNLGNFSQVAGTGYNTIQGRALIGGNATFNTYTSGSTVNNPTVCTVNCSGNTTAAVDSSGATYGALTVFGNLVTPAVTSNGSIAYAGVGAGDVSVKGTGAAGTAAITGNVLLNASNSSGTGKLNVVNAVAGNGATNIGNAAAIRTSQSSFNGGTYTYNPSTGALGTGVTPTTGVSAATVFPFSTAYQKNVTDLAQGIANLPGTPGVHAQALPSSNAIFFTASADYTAADGLTYGVVTTTLANLASGTGAGGVSNGSNTGATFVIVTGDGANYTLPNLNSYAGANDVIYDFVNATTLKFAGNWNGTILAPLATITQQGGNISGSVVVASIAQSNALNDGNSFSGNLSGLVGLTAVPEPASLALLGIGTLGAALLRRRR